MLALGKGVLRSHRIPRFGSEAQKIAHECQLNILIQDPREGHRYPDV